MTRDEAVALVHQGLMFRSGQSAAIINALQAAQRTREMGKSLPWFLVQEDQTLTGTANSPTISPLPTGFIRVVEDEAIGYYVGGVFVRKLERTEYNQAQRVWLGTSKTEPYAWALRTAKITIFPTPTAAFTLKWSYYKKDALLTSNIENAWLLNAPDILINEAGLRVAGDIGYDEGVKKFAAALAMADRAFTAEMTLRETTGMDEIIMGGNI